MNGASAGLIGTLKSYGLLHENNEGIRVTDNAVALIMAPEESPDRAEALWKSVFAPKVFTDLRETYGEDLSELPSEENLRYFLVKKGLLENAAAEAVRVYRDNLELVTSEETEFAPETTSDESSEAQMHSQPTGASAAVGRRSSASVGASAASFEEGYPKEFLHVFAKGCDMRLLIEGAVTREAIEKLIEYLKLGKDDLPSSSSAIGQPAIAESVEQLPIEMPASE